MGVCHTEEQTLELTPFMTDVCGNALHRTPRAQKMDSNRRAHPLRKGVAPCVNRDMQDACLINSTPTRVEPCAPEENKPRHALMSAGPVKCACTEAQVQPEPAASFKEAENNFFSSGREEHGSETQGNKLHTSQNHTQYFQRKQC
ncbi:hypothetical protein NDU88_002657 [Pleurodeles waltl]|uniref:Uncharacterized protein n=1 Tax=Pleurodeles waltl TaxID=8319 RepID=A0AAV7MQB3_PLEWA|nr:hypothetical protein NDU88_002657 [Pleurodeles waltl]